MTLYDYDITYGLFLKAKLKQRQTAAKIMPSTLRPISVTATGNRMVTVLLFGTPS